MKPAVLTAIYGGYDTLKDPPEQSIDCEWVCVTDDPDLRSDIWRIEYEAFKDVHPRLAAKNAKFVPWRYSQAEQSVWIDGSAQITSSTFVAEVLETLGDSHIAQIEHPWRGCIYEEARASYELPKYEGLPVYEQVRTYRNEGHPENWGLWATGLIARNHTSEMERLGVHWFQECNLWTYQDQLSEPHLLRRLGIRPVEFEHPLHGNPWISWHNHRSEF